MGNVGSFLVGTHVMFDDWMVRYVSKALGRDWMVGERLKGSVLVTEDREGIGGQYEVPYIIKGRKS